MRSFIDDIAGSVYDLLKTTIVGFYYLLAGMLGVGALFFAVIVLIRIYSFFIS